MPRCLSKRRERPRHRISRPHAIRQVSVVESGMAASPKCRLLLHNVETMNHSTTPTLLARNQGAILSKLNPSAALNWLLQDMKSLPRWPVKTVLAICISVAIGTSSYLLWTHLTSSPIAGCGSGGGWIDCEGVARSRWSVWFGVPVSLLALAIYVAMAASLVVASLDRFSRPRRGIAWIVVTAAVFAAGMSAIWSIAVQLLVLQHICLYCMLAHTCGLVATITLLVAGPLRAKSAMAFASLHLWMLADDHPPTYADTITKARTLVDSKKLDVELASDVPDQYISRHVALYERVGEGAIPKLMFPRTSVVGKFTSVDGLVDLIRREAL